MCVVHHEMSLSVKNLSFLPIWRHFLSRGSRLPVCLILFISDCVLSSVLLIVDRLDITLLSKVARSGIASYVFSLGGHSVVEILLVSAL